MSFFGCKAANLTQTFITILFCASRCCHVWGAVTQVSGSIAYPKQQRVSDAKGLSARVFQALVEGMLLPITSTLKSPIAAEDPLNPGTAARPVPLRRRQNAGVAAGKRVRWSAQFSHYLARPLLQAGPLVFGVCVLAVIITAWVFRDEGHLTAETGIGYWLGIAGSVTMLILILYPLRKRYKILHGLGRVASWFRVHMVLGILGPTLIILHCNFKIGSLNSRLALFTMLIVVASGIVGRYLYSQVHKGLYGSRADVRDILSDIETLKGQLGLDLAASPSISARLDAFNGRVSQLPASTIGGMWGALTIRGRVRRVRRQLLRDADAALRIQAHQNGWTRRQKRDRLGLFGDHLRTYFSAVTKAQRLALFERLFAFWHVLHMPLFVLLALTVVIHIVAVHLY